MLPLTSSWCASNTMQEALSILYKLICTIFIKININIQDKLQTAYFFTYSKLDVIFNLSKIFMSFSKETQTSTVQRGLRDE